MVVCEMQGERKHEQSVLDSDVDLKPEWGSRKETEVERSEAQLSKCCPDLG